MRSFRKLHALLLLPLAGCMSDDQWTFSVSRAVYEGDVALYDSYTPSGDGEADVIFLLLPLALDVVLLPVTVPRDLIVHGGL